MAVVPNVRAGRGVELPHVRKEAREVRVTVQGGEDRGPRDVVVGAPGHPGPAVLGPPV